MPRLHSLQVSDVRNVKSAELEFGPDFNIFYGVNGAGKTSLLEAIYLLSTGRSFRTNKHSFIINRESELLSVFSRVLTDVDYRENREVRSSDSQAKLGVQKHRRQKPKARINGEDVRTSSELAKTLPLLCIEPSSFDLLEGGPSIRRTLIDWLVFHVKPDFLDAYKDYSRCLKQRNILLRSDKIAYSDIAPWDELLLSASSVLDLVRGEAVSGLVKHIQSSYSSMVESLELGFEFKSGWGAKAVLDSEFDGPTSENSISNDDKRKRLVDNFHRDRALGHTSLGSHRFDLVVHASGKPSTDVLSRGQKKKLIICFYLAVSELYKQSLKKAPVLLLDDLPSEIDQKTMSWLLEAISRLEAQTFISSLERGALESALKGMQSKDACWFHVKHGVVEKEQ